MAVEQHPSAARDPLERLGGEVVAQDRRHLHPLDPPQRRAPARRPRPRAPRSRRRASRGAHRRRTGTRTTSSRRRPRARRAGRARRAAAGTAAARARRTSPSRSLAGGAPAAPAPRTTARRRCGPRRRRRRHALDGPITASGRTTRKRKAERQHEGESKARQRAADRHPAGMRVIDEVQSTSSVRPARATGRDRNRRAHARICPGRNSGAAKGSRSPASHCASSTPKSGTKNDPSR